MNTLPFLHGLAVSPVGRDIDLILDHPAACARMLDRGDVDVALCPVGALLDKPSVHIITRYAIGCDGPVRTVAVYSHHRPEDIRRIALNRDSRTSNVLVQLLDRLYWERGIEFVDKVANGAQTGILSIGDACFRNEKIYPYRIDLGEAWKILTGLPFVFACWVSLKPLEPVIEAALNDAFKAGVDGIADMPIEPHPFGNIDVREYLMRNISFLLDEQKLRAMHYFIEKARELSIQSTYVTQTSS